MESPTNPYYSRIFAAFPDFSYKTGKKFAFRPPRTIILGPPEPRSELLLLHELSHALLGHKSFRTDVERLRIESAAWEKAKSLAKELNIPYSDDFAQSRLDSYRDWLHKKSLCKICHLTRYQTPDGVYHCPHCTK